MKTHRRTKLRRPGAVMALTVLAALAAAPARAAGGASCAVSATPLAFGRYMPAWALPDDLNATITVTCTASGSTPVPIRGTIALTVAAGPSGRRLNGGRSALRYELYLDPGRTVPWGNGTGGTGTILVSGVASPTAPFRQAFTVYGRILARQSGAHVGHYADQATVFLNY